MTTRIRASDATAWVKCRRRAWFDHQPGHIELQDDAFEKLVQEAGQEHESRVLEQLAPDGRFTVARDAEHTQQLMEERTALIYQPVGMSESPALVGRPDFLIFDDGSYRVADAKLASSIRSRKDILIQLALYRRLFETRLAGQVFLGNGEVVEVGKAADQQADDFLADMDVLLDSAEIPEAHFSYYKCAACPYQTLCLPEFERDQALTLLYRLDSRAVAGLNAQGIYTIEDLANSDWRALQDVPWLKGETRRRLMVEQAQVYLSGQWRLIEPLNLPEGTWVHFDIESNPLDEAGGQVYLWGFLEPDYEPANYLPIWSEPDPEADFRTWQAFLQQVLAYRRRYPDLVLAHYGNFELTQIRRYAQRYDMFEHPAVSWLLGEDTPLFDMLTEVKRCLILPLKSYGLKAICKAAELVDFQWELEESGSQWSVVQYVQYAQCSDLRESERIKREILSYNRDDVLATRALEQWLRRQV